jgi:dihydrofolate reductase
MPKVVYSKTLTSAGWNTTIARDVVRGDVEELKLRARGDLVVGGGDLGAAFMAQDLIDEYRIYVHPIRIGEGKPLFPPSKEKVLLRLAETRTFGNGVVLLRYERLRPRGGSLTAWSREAPRPCRDKPAPPSDAGRRAAPR